MIETRSSLLRRVRDPADQASWREFVALYQPLLRRAVRIGGVPDACVDDVVQQVFVRLLAALPRFELDRSRGRFRDWLWRLTHNVVVDQLRRHGRQEAAEQRWREQQPGEEPVPDDWREDYHRRVLAFALQRVQGDTQPGTWACFQRHLLQGQRAADVAEQLGLSTRAVYVNASRVLARVRACCAEYEEELGEGHA